MLDTDKNNLKRLQEELEKKLKQRPRLSKEFKVAYDFGDETENFPLEEARMAIDKNEREIERLQELINKYDEKDQKKHQTKGKLRNGSIFVLTNARSQKSQSYKLIDDVGHYLYKEGDIRLVSLNSPLGKILVGKKTGETVTLDDLAITSFIIKEILEE